MRDLPIVLLIDDQWAEPGNPMIPERYGHLPFDWRFETARDKGNAYSVTRAVEAVHRECPAAVLLDIMFGQQLRLGVDILRAVRDAFPVLPILVFTNLDSDEHRELVIDCMGLGANEYLEKAPDAEQMKRVLGVYTDQSLDRALYGNSPPIRQLRADIARVSFSGAVNVLVYGESGTGKELVAAALHRQGSRFDRPFIAKNCAHSDSQLLESELFGHTKGAFTGAISDRPGLLEDADKGVLFLDEVADIPLELQAKLLRVLETKRFRRVGRNAEQSSDFQLVSATNQEPAQLTTTGRLRPDFYYRIAALTLSVPPLRERLHDVPILAQMFLDRFRATGGRGYPGDHFSATSLAVLCRYPWPGNVRELRNVVERSVILSRSSEIDIPRDALPSSVNPTPARAQALVGLPSESQEWPKARLLAELSMCVAAKRHVVAYKGAHWKAEFMRLMYPECRAANAKGFADLIKRLTQGPWSVPNWQHDTEIRTLLSDLMS